MRRIGRRVFRFLRELSTFLYRISNGRVGGRISGMPVLLLRTVGRKTGELRTVPLMYQPDGQSLVITASNNGGDRHPGWYHNLLSDPDVEVQVGSEIRKVRARITEPEERRVRYQGFVDALGRFGTYQERTSRDIPVVVLEPRE